MSMAPILSRRAQTVWLAAGLLALAACDTSNFDLDMRDNFGGDF